MATREHDDATGFSLGMPAGGALSGHWLILLWVIICGIYSALHFTLNRSQIVEVLRQVVYLVPFLLAFAVAPMAIRKSAGRERRLWYAIEAAVGLVFLSEVLVSVRVIQLGRVPDVWSASSAALSILAAGVFIATLVSLADYRMLSTVARVHSAVDTLGTSLLVFGFVLWAAMGPLARGYDAGDPVGNVVLATFSMIGFLTMIATSLNFATRQRVRWQRCERLLISGIGVYGFATGLFPLWNFGAEVSRLSHWELPVELLWMTGMLLVFAGAYGRSQMAEGQVCFLATPRLRPDESRWHAVTSSVVFICGVPFFGYLALATEADPITSGAYAVCAVGLTVVLVARSVVSASENQFFFGHAVNDQLTDVYGHRYFYERLGIELDLARRNGTSLYVLVVDLDGFSRVNAGFGHAFGDEILRGVAAALVGVVRPRDIVCRLGADEFAVIMPAVCAEDTAASAGQIRGALARIDSGEGTTLTASFGYAGYPFDSLERDELVHKAVGALDWAKYHGRDMIVAFDESVVDLLSAHDRIKHLEQESHLSTVRALAAAVDARDPLTQFHSRNVAVLAVMLAEEIELAQSRRGALEVAALLHDVGKIGICDRVLRKRGPLLASEMRHIREHPGLGEKILASTQLVEILPWVRHHHERWDGGGYPDGLAGEAIPFEARVLCICDAYDAMTSGRPYRDALSPIAALQELDLCIGSQFDPVLAEAFIRMVGRRKLLRPGLQSARDNATA